MFIVGSDMYTSESAATSAVKIVKEITPNRGLTSIGKT